MNISQMHERLRLDLLRRIQRGALSVSMLARQTGFGESHLSNFLHRKRQLSLEGLDRVLAAQQLTVADLLPSRSASAWASDEMQNIPVVSHNTAMHEPIIRSGAVQQLVRVMEGTLERIRPRPSRGRAAWSRFVAIRASSSDAAAMDPILMPDAVVVLDRHYNSLHRYRPSRLNLYAVRHDAHLKLRYADFQAGRLLLVPRQRSVPIDVIATEGWEMPEELIVGRVVMVMNEI